MLDLAELMGCGLTPRAAQHRERAGTLRRLHRGVYLVGPLLTDEGRWRAAVLAGGAAVLLSGGAAPALHGFGGDPGDARILLPFGAPRGPATVPSRRTRTLVPADRVLRRGIPVASVERTLVERSGDLGRDPLERELHEARVLRLLDVDRLRATIDRAGPRRGVGTLHSLLDGLFHGPTRNELERRFARLVRQAKLGRPARNVTLRLTRRTIQADAYWRDAGLVVELDGRAAHEWRFVADRDRDLDLAVDGLLCIRLTWWHLTKDAERTAERLRRLIEQRCVR